MSLPRSGGNAIYVVASNCPARIRGGADFVCDGVADEVQINAALAALTARYGGVVRLSPGTFTVAAPMALTQGQKIWGSGMQATTVQAALDHPFDMFRWALAPTFGPTTASGGSGTTITFAGDVTASIAVGAVIRIARGTGYGQKRTVTSRAYAGGTTTVTISAGATDWGVNPDNTSVAVVDAPSELFAGLGHMIVSGRRKTSDFLTGNTGIYGLADAATTDGVLIDSVGAADIFPEWVDECSVYIYGGTGIGQMLRILGREKVGDYYTKLLLDGPWWTPLDATSKYAVVGAGFAQYGPNCLDFMFDNIWFTQMTGWGLQMEFTWGCAGQDLISEYNDMGGMRVSQAPLSQTPSTGTWGSTTTGQVANSGPKLVNSKIVSNGSEYGLGGTGLQLFGRVNDSRISNNEFGSYSTLGHGVDLRGGYGSGPFQNGIVNNMFGSWDAIDVAVSGYTVILNAGVRLGGSSVNNVVVGNSFRLTNAAGARCAIMVPTGGGQRNVVVGNQYSLGTECFFVHNESTGGGGVLTQGKDGSGFNLYSGNIASVARQMDHYAGIASGVAAATVVAYTFPAELMEANASVDFLASFVPADVQTAALTGWYLSALTYQGISFKHASASEGTTTGAAIEATGSSSVLVGDSSMFVVGGTARIDSGASAEDVVITAIDDGTHVTATWTKTHLTAVAIKPVYKFYTRIEQECRATGLQ
jgi:hypothetical protein